MLQSDRSTRSRMDRADYRHCKYSHTLNYAVDNKHTDNDVKDGGTIVKLTLMYYLTHRMCGF